MQASVIKANIHADPTCSTERRKEREDDERSKKDVGYRASLALKQKYIARNQVLLLCKPFILPWCTISGSAFC